MTSPPYLTIFIIVKLRQCFINLLLKMFGTSITNNMQYSLSDPHIGVSSHLENPFPEHIDIFLDLAWAQLLAGLKTDIIVLRASVLEDCVNVLGCAADVQDVFLGLLCGVLSLFLVVSAFTHTDIIMVSKN